MFCEHYNKIELKKIYECENETLKIYFCKDCYSIYKFRYQFHPATGNDSFVIYPGTKERDIKFTIEEFIEVLNENKNLLNISMDEFSYFEDMKIKDMMDTIIQLNTMRMYYTNFMKNLLKYFNKNEKDVEI